MFSAGGGLDANRRDERGGPLGPPELNPVGRVRKNQALYSSKCRRTYLYIVNIRTKVAVRIRPEVRTEAGRCTFAKRT